MTVAIALRLEEASAQRVDALTQALPYRQSNRIPPLIRLATFDDGIDVCTLKNALTEAAYGWRKLRVRFDRIGVR